MSDCILSSVTAAAGCLAGLLRLPCLFGRPLWRRGRPQPFAVPATGLDAAALGSGFEDVYFTSADGTRLHAVEGAGFGRRGLKRPLVFVHGFPDMWTSWEGQMQFFASLGHPVMAISLRGSGLSDKPSDPEMYDLETCLVADMRAGLDYVREMCGQKPVLVAHGVGALIGWRLLTLTADAPAVAGFVSLSMPPLEACARGLRSLSQLYNWLYILAFSMPIVPEALLTFQNAFLGAVLLNDLERAQVRPELLHLSRANLLQPQAARGHLNYYRMLVRKMTRSVLRDKADTYWSGLLRGRSEHQEVLGSHRKLKLPVLILKGSHDHICKEGLFVDLATYLDKYRLVVIEPCSHRVHLDAMAEVNTEISQWLLCL